MSMQPNMTGRWTFKNANSPRSSKMIATAMKNAHNCLSTMLGRKPNLETGTLIMQYEVSGSAGKMCVEPFIHLYGKGDFAPEDLSDGTEYVVSFGPAFCPAKKSVHFSFRHRNPMTDVFEEKFMINAPVIDVDDKLHLYTLIVRPDNSFDILVDALVVRSGDLLTDFDPPVNPSPEISDPRDKKPATWAEKSHIVDENGKTVANPEYVGPWEARKIVNPGYFEDYEPHNFGEIIGVGFEFIVDTTEVGLANIYIDDNETSVHTWNLVHFKPSPTPTPVPEKTPEPTPTEEVVPFEMQGRWIPPPVHERIWAFLKDVTKAYDRLADSHQEGAIIIVIVIGLIPIMIMVQCCCTSRMTGGAAAKRKKRLNKRIRRRANEMLEEMRANDNSASGEGTDGRRKLD